MRDFQELIVWQKGHHLTLEIYQITRDFPKSELYGLTSQVRRAASSIPANIAKGCGRSGDAELNRFLVIALGSIAELHCHLILARDLTYLKEENFNSILVKLTETRKMLIAFSRKLKPSPHSS